MIRCRLHVTRRSYPLDARIVENCATFDLFRDGTVSSVVRNDMIRELLEGDFNEHIGFPPEHTTAKKADEQAHIVAICHYLTTNLGFDVDVSYPAPEELPIGGNF